MLILLIINGLWTYIIHLFSKIIYIYMNYIFIILIVIAIFIVFTSGKDSKEHMDNTNEAVQNIASIYNKEKMDISNLTVSRNLSVSQNLSVSGTFNLLPKGVIVAWNGTDAPQGWALCDGGNGTPDLRGRFIRMFNDGVNAQSAFGDANVYKTGLKSSLFDSQYVGAARGTKESWIAKFKHGDFGGTDHMVLSQGEMPIHTHGVCLPKGDKNWDGGGGNTMWGGDRCNGKIQSDPAGSGWGHNNMPPFYTLAYIMKL
jgi:hypothetical protein